MTRAGIVHVVAMDLAAGADEGWSAGLLDAAERQRAGALVFDRDRRRYCAAHAMMRHALGQWLDTDPSRLRFATTGRGKPCLTDVALDLRFNLSHSGDRALLAVAVGRDVGVDLEQWRADPDMAKAARLFSPREQRAIGALPPHDRARAFLACWTRKESFVKALGEGLAFPLQGFSVSLEPGRARLLECPAAPEQLDRWTVSDLSAGHAFVAALTAEGDDWEVQCWRTVRAARGGFAIEKSGQLTCT